MRKILITPATFKPLEVELIMVRPEIRGIVGSNDNLLVADFLESAIEGYQDYTGNILCRSTWDLYLDAFPKKDIETPGPLATVESIKYQDSADAQQTLSSSSYVVDITDPMAGRIALVSGQSWGSTIAEINSVVVRLTAGYLNAGSIPQRIKDGLVAYIQEMLSGIDMSGVYHNKWQATRRIPI